MGAPAPPRAVKKIFFRRNLEGKCVSAPLGHEVHPPQPEQESILGQFLWVRFGGVFRRSLRATTKKGRQLFLVKKVHPRTKSWLRLCMIARR